MSNYRSSERSGGIGKYIVIGVVVVAVVAVIIFFATRPSGQTPKVVTTAANAVTFQIPLNGDSSQQNVINSVEFWQTYMKPNVHNIVITQYQLPDDSTHSWHDSTAVVAVDTSTVTRTWIVKSVTDADPHPDNSDAFNVQVESTGIWTGAQIGVHIRPEDASLFLKNYNYASTIDPAGFYKQHDISDIINNEIRTYLMSELMTEYSKYPLVDIQTKNVDAAIFDAVGKRLKETFAAKGLTVDYFGQQGGDVYENGLMQDQIDAQLLVKSNIAQATTAAIQAQIHQQATADALEAQATQEVISAQAHAQATAIAVNAELERQQRQAELLRQYPELLEYERIQKWNGNPSYFAGSDNSSYLIQAPDGYATATPAP